MSGTEARESRWPFLAAGGEMGTRMRAHDWTGHPLGSPDTWPQSLRSMVSNCLRSPLLTTVLWGPDLRMLYNDAYIPSMTDRHPAALGAPVAEVWGDAWQQVAPLFVNAMTTGTGFAREGVVIEMVRRGVPETTYWDLIATPFCGEDGSVAGLFNQGFEITERVLAERRVASGARRQGLVYQQMPGFVAVLHGPRHVFDYVNDAYVRIAGPRDFVGRSFRDVFPELEDQGFNELLDHVYAVGEPFRAQTMPVLLAGEKKRRYVDLLFQPIREDDGRVTGVFVGGYDVTKAQLDREELKALNADLERQVAQRLDERNRIWETSEDLFAHADFEGHILGVSPSWTRTFGRDETELKSRSYLLGIHPDDFALVTEQLAKLKATRRPVSYTNRIAHADGSWKSIQWSLVPEVGRDRFHAVGRDVTAEREAAAVRSHLEDQLRQAQKMEAVGQLTGGLAHDFNNLLAGISGSLELMELRLRQGRHEGLERYLNAAQGAAKRAAALTHRLLAFSRRQTLDPKPVDVNRLVRDMEELIRRTVGPSIEIEVVGAVDLWPALVDPPQLENSLLNLCLNARDAMPDGGRITIETANLWIDEAAGREHDMPAGHYLSVCVTDTGTGMTADVVAKAFDPFFTTKPIGSGTGLGLSMTYGFARQSGGQVRIRSAVGQGTTVCVYLPRHVGDRVDDAATPVAVDAIREGHGETVLVVDDEPTVRMLVVEVLEGLGYVALEASDGISGLKTLQSDVRIDLLISDVGLPGGMNGRQMADAGRVSRPGLKVLFITGYAETAVLGNGGLEPGMQVLTKPFALDTLAGRIEDLIASR